MVFLLLPGYTFVRRRQRDLPAHETSALAEVIAVVFAGLIIDACVTVAFLGVRGIVPALPPDLDTFMRTPGDYTRQHLTEVVLTIMILVVVATALGYAASTHRVLARAAKVFGGPPEGHQSAWWLLFAGQHADKAKYVSCVLDDGSVIRGTLFSFSRSSKEHGDRELVLAAPLSYSLGSDQTTSDLEGVAAVSISSRKIDVMMVSYLDPQPPAPNDNGNG